MADKTYYSRTLNNQVPNTSFTRTNPSYYNQRDVEPRHQPRTPVSQQVRYKSPGIAGKSPIRQNNSSTYKTYTPLSQEDRSSKLIKKPPCTQQNTPQVKTIPAQSGPTKQLYSPPTLPTQFKYPSTNISNPFCFKEEIAQIDIPFKQNNWTEKIISKNSIDNIQSPPFIQNSVLESDINEDRNPNHDVQNIKPTQKNSNATKPQNSLTIEQINRLVEQNNSTSPNKDNESQSNQTVQSNQATLVNQNFQSNQATLVNHASLLNQTMLTNNSTITKEGKTFVLIEKKDLEDLRNSVKDKDALIQQMQAKSSQNDMLIDCLNKNWETSK